MKLSLQTWTKILGETIYARNKFMVFDLINSCLKKVKACLYYLLKLFLFTSRKWKLIFILSIPRWSLDKGSFMKIP